MTPSAISSACILALACALPGWSAPPVPELSGAFLLNRGDTTDLTQRRTGGFALEAGLLFSPEDIGPKLETYLGYARIKAGVPTADRPTYRLDSPYLGISLIYRPWKIPLILRFGPEFHVWQVEEQVAGAAPIAQGDRQNLKLGWRAGLGYDVAAHWTVSLNYVITEWRMDPNLASDSNGWTGYIEGVNPSRPSYFTLMATYRF